MRSYYFLIFILVSCQDINIISKESSAEIESELKTIDITNTEENKYRLQLIENNNELKVLHTIDPDKHGFDNTQIVLSLMEESNNQWEFYAYKSGNQKRKNYYRDELFKNVLMYQNKENKYINSETNSILFNTTTKKTTHLTNKVVISPIHGKRKYSRYSPKKLILWKTLGPRKGCKVTLDFHNDIGDQLFRNKPQTYYIHKIIHSNNEDFVFAELKNHLNNDVLYLRKTSNEELIKKWKESDYPYQEKNDSALFKLKNQIGLKKSKILKYRVITLTALGAVGGLAIGAAIATGIILTPEDLPNTPEPIVSTFYEKYPDNTIFDRGLIPSPTTNKTIQIIKNLVGKTNKNEFEEILKNRFESNGGYLSSEDRNYLMNRIAKDLNLGEDYFKYQDNYNLELKSKKRSHRFIIQMVTYEESGMDRFREISQSIEIKFSSKVMPRTFKTSRDIFNLNMSEELSLNTDELHHKSKLEELLTVDERFSKALDEYLIRNNDRIISFLKQRYLLNGRITAGDKLHIIKEIERGTYLAEDILVNQNKTYQFDVYQRDDLGYLTFTIKPIDKFIRDVYRSYEFTYLTFLNGSDTQ